MKICERIFFISGLEKHVIILTAQAMEKKFGNREYCNENKCSLFVNEEEINRYIQCGIGMSKEDIAYSLCSFYRQSELKKKGII